MARPIGSKNKIPQETREVLKTLLENNLTKLDEWINKVARTDPARACDLVLAVTHYVIPRLKSIEVKDNDLAKNIPILTAYDGVVKFPENWPGMILHLAGPDYVDAPLMAYVGPEGAKKEPPRSSDLIVIPRKDGRDPLVIVDDITPDESTEAPPTPPPTAPAPTTPAPPPPTSPPRTIAEARRRRNRW